ncbi:RNA polymerase sigma factor [Sphaerotilus microaerophilus]|uniref:RNA polymerase sigma E protein n=1 Tax=Sphaerotilus microaerophilus TaxID=2914710 RepID=A0ABM7YPP0_9BURK|nr:sigma-70 family RNA polymerase sigma factor [Sphaerotilus sp. FB-5]BDI06446.1 putative RNA polymerase sigma E protein [Sphaerotilus sp. FB-5]
MSPGQPSPPSPQERQRRDLRLVQLLSGAARGSADDFETFYDLTIGHARALARRIVHGADLDDALADAYLDAWRRLGSYDPARGTPLAWLLSIVHSRTLDLCRHRNPRLESFDAQPDGAEAADDRPDPSETLWQLQAGQRLAVALAGLSAQERWLLGLAYFRYASHAAIAETTGLPLGTVKSSILRAQAKLRLQLQPVT